MHNINYNYFTHVLGEESMRSTSLVVDEKVPTNRRSTKYHRFREKRSKSFCGELRAKRSSEQLHAPTSMCNIMADNEPLGCAPRKTGDPEDVSLPTDNLSSCKDLPYEVTYSSQYEDLPGTLQDLPYHLVPLTLSSLNLPLSYSSTTSRELLS